jgi:hypothetical protein
VSNHGGMVLTLESRPKYVSFVIAPHGTSIEIYESAVACWCAELYLCLYMHMDLRLSVIQSLSSGTGWRGRGLEGTGYERAPVVTTNYIQRCIEVRSLLMLSLFLYLHLNLHLYQSLTGVCAARHQRLPHFSTASPRSRTGRQRTSHLYLWYVFLY